MDINYDELENFWMPFTSNKHFKDNPKILTSASGVYYYDYRGQQVLDGTAGHACVNAGHNRREIIEAVYHQANKLDYAPAFKFGHPGAFKYANLLKDITPEGLNQVFFVNSGSEAVDTALKIALAYYAIQGEHERTHFIGRELAYHGAGFGGISVGGIGANSQFCTSLLPAVSHLKSTYNLQQNAFSRGQPQWGAHLADELEEHIQKIGKHKIAAVIIEPISVTSGIYIPPVGYLERIREICTNHNLLLIFDEVITGFGRAGAPFAAEYFGVVPDMITSAKGLTNSTFPMGAVFVKDDIYNVFNKSTADVELFHGYTCSGHPIGCAAGIANLNIFKHEQLFYRANELEDIWVENLFKLQDLAYVRDLRCFGLLAAIDLEPIPGEPGKRGEAVLDQCYEKGLLLRSAQDHICLSPPLTINHEQIAEMFNILYDVIKQLK